MDGLDAYYTPMPLADKLVSYIPEYPIQTTIDFCIGDGNLLKAVQKKFNNVQFFGIDISKNAIDKISIENSNWHLGVCDFRDNQSINKIQFLKNSKFDLIVLNPPFSCKGSIVEQIELDGILFKVSTAMMFVIKAIKYLATKGSMYAILPISCVYSQKDKLAWQYLQNNFNACVLEEPQRVYFDKKCSPNIVLMYLGYKKRTFPQIIANTDFSKLKVTNIVRGNIRMQKLSYCNSLDSIPLIHTTNIKNGKLVNIKRISPMVRLTIAGYGVVIPRVCNPSPKKIALLDGEKTYALSDCIIVLQTSTKDDAEQIYKHILCNWPIFENLYKGTGAKYTTLERVKNLFFKTII